MTTQSPLKPPISATTTAANNVTNKRTEPLLVSCNSNNDNSNHTSVNKTCDVALSRQAASNGAGGVAATTGGKRDPSPPKLSYSVNFFTWSVSDCSSEEENEDCRNVTMSLNRLKIRKSSKERNEKSARSSNS